MASLNESKFVVGLGLVTLIIAAGLVYLGLRTSSKLELVKDEISNKQKRLREVKNLEPYPTPTAASEKKLALQKVVDETKKAQDELLKFSPDLKSMSESEFIKLLNGSVERTKALFKEREAVLPSRFSWRPIRSRASPAPYLPAVSTATRPPVWANHCSTISCSASGDMTCIMLPRLAVPNTMGGKSRPVAPKGCVGRIVEFDFSVIVAWFSRELEKVAGR